MYPAVAATKAGYRRSLYERHAIYFVIDDDTIEIRAVVKRQDVSGRLWAFSFADRKIRDDKRACCWVA